MRAAEGETVLTGEGMEVLGTQECRALLGLAKVGRVGVCIGAIPAVLPVNFALDGDSVVFRTGEGTTLKAATDRAVVAFQCDRVDEFEHSGWSVLVVGMARAVTDPGELERLRGLPLRPWAPGQKDCYVRIPFELVSGRRISTHHRL